MMRRLILFCGLFFFFLFLSLIPVKGAADCPVCPSGYNWSYTLHTCQKGPTYVPPIYDDCGSCQCNPGEGCQPPCQSPSHPGLYTCVWSRFLGCKPSSNCTTGSQSGDECRKFHDRLPCINAGPFTCVAITPPAPGEPYDICQRNSECLGCVGAGNSWTAIGCITTSDPQAFIAWLLTRAIGIAGGIAFLLMIFAGLQIITSAGDPKRLQSGKEMLTSAIIGLIVIIFSIFLLQLIGVEILKIPGFTK